MYFGMSVMVNVNYPRWITETLCEYSLFQKHPVYIWFTWSVSLLVIIQRIYVFIINLFLEAQLLAIHIYVTDALRHTVTHGMFSYVVYGPIWTFCTVLPPKIVCGSHLWKRSEKTELCGSVDLVFLSFSWQLNICSITCYHLFPDPLFLW